MEQKVKSLSWSKVNSWLTNKKQFMDTYFAEKPFFETKEIIFGSVLGKCIELQEFNNEDYVINEVMRGFDGEIKTDSRKEQIARDSFKTISQNQFFIDKIQDLLFDFGSEYERKLQQFINGVCLLGFADNTDKELLNIYEFKTGKTPWNQERVNEHGQLDFYSLLVLKEKGYFPKKVDLIWFETEEDENGNIKLSGKIEVFTYDIEKNKERIKNWEKKLPIILKEIQEEYKKWLNSEDNKQNLDEDIFISYADLEREKKLIEDKQKGLKNQIDEILKSNEIQNYKLDGVGSFYYTQKKVWDYSKTILKKEQKLNDEFKEKMKKIDELKKIFEEKNKPQITMNLAFRLEKEKNID